MTTNQEGKHAPDLANSDIMENGSNGTPETELQATEAEEKQQERSVAFTVATVEQPRRSSLKEPVQRRRGHIEPCQVTGGGSESRRTSYKTKSGQTKDGSRRMSSLEMRRLPVDILLSPAFNDAASVLSDDFQIEDKEKKVVGEKKGLLHILCLRPGYSLQTQLMLSFGTISIITVIAVVVTCIIVAVMAGENVKDISREAFEGIATETQGLTSRYLAESLAEKLLLVDVVKLIHEATQDRFAGYPSTSEDEVPFFDVLSGQFKYPIDFPPPPLEWQFESNINEDNYEEHFQGQNYYKTREASTSSGSFLMKGICDPSETDPLGDAYWPNCTAANNNISTGGLWEPTNTTELIYNKGKDLIPLLKALYESRDVIRDMGLYFSNSGAGASINYPHYPISTQSTYLSTGCEWMSTPNALDPSKPIGTPEMIARCSPKDEIVSSRIYSPMERGWCVDQALEPDRIHYDSGPDAWDNGFWLLSMGRAVYDRITNEFIACVYVGISLGAVDKELEQARVVEGETISMIEWSEEGTIVGSSIENRNSSESISIYEMDLGVTKEDHNTLFHLVDFESEWDPGEVRRIYSNFAVRNQKYFVSAYPVPPVPDTYDENYRPLFMVVAATPLDTVFGIVSDASDIVDERVRHVNIFCVAAGAVGLAIALIIISMMAKMLTSPLRKMNDVATDIVNSFGDPTKEQAIENSAEGNVSKEARCTPRTELSDVVKEFNKMVASFSGESMVKSERHKHHEVYNMFSLHEDFLKLYESRGGANFKYAIEPPSNKDWVDEDTEDEQSYVHAGSNMMEDHDTFTTSPKKAYQKKGKNFSSPLFLWIVALIVTPLLVVNIVITAVALNTVASEFTDSIAQAEVFFLEVEKKKLGVHSRLRADLVAELTAKATSNLHVLTRYSEWLVFGALNPSESYPELMTGVEECKEFRDISSCPFVQENDVCDCAWNDRISESTCRPFPNGSRKLQKPFWVCQSQDADENGNRFASSYPKKSFSPETTDWWDDQELVPGWDNSSMVGTGHSNLFERLRTGSSIPVFEAIYNYPELKDSTIATYIAFESDGLMIGYAGCATASHVAFKDFQSTVENGAARLRPELCPLGKYGFDPRCRGWYDTGRNLAMVNNTYLHVTAPYEFATTGGKVIFAQTATAPLIDPETSEHIGQVLIDFRPSDIIRIVEEDTPLSSGGFPILVATESGFDADTVIGPEYKLSDPPSPIVSKVLAIDVDCNDAICRSNTETFNKVVDEMKAGLEGNATFYRTTGDGFQERVHLAYAPVSVRSFRPLDSSDFSRGLDAAEYLIYSLGLVETESGMFETFDPIEDVTQQQINTAIVILSVLLVVATFLVVYVSLRVTQSIAEPMVYLLEIIRSIRNKESEAPALRTVKASQEIVKFADSIEMLSKVVRSANMAFYAGEFEVAYFVLVDALRLFRRLDNKKAIGIACNNLGNIMMGMYQEMTKENIEKLAGLTKRQLVIKGITYYHEAIQLGEKAYDEFYALHGWTPICLDFMQHLSNRYFNRAVFLLSTKDIYEKPEELEELGKRDLNIAADMDSEVIAYGEDIGWSSNDRIGKVFDVKIVRAGGYNLLLEMGYEDEWDVNDLLDEAYHIVVTEKERATSDLFLRVTCPGRMQELETEIMKYYEAVGDIDAAAKVAVRCLFEDEKVFVDTQSRALEVLILYTDRKRDLSDPTKTRIKNALQDYTDMVEDAVNHQTQASIVDMESDVISKATGGSGRSKRFSARAWSLQQSSGRFVTMEDF